MPPVESGFDQMTSNDKAASGRTHLDKLELHGVGLFEFEPNRVNLAA